MFFEPPQPPPAAPPAATAPAPQSSPALHPIITEVLFAVPTEKSAKGDLSRCDANGDGTRHVAGDEFVELFNPHDRPIQLKGYTLSDRGMGYEPAPGSGSSRKKDTSKFSFTFPALELKPGEVAVVFNGCDATWTGAVGDSTLAPPIGNPGFSGAYVFTARVKSQRVAFGNSGDWVLLSAPDGKPVECVVWGDVTDGPAGCPSVAHAPEDPRSSVARRPGASAEFQAHLDLAGVPFGPGSFGDRPPTAGVEEPPPSGAPGAGR